MASRPWALCHERKIMVNSFWTMDPDYSWRIRSGDVASKHPLKKRYSLPTACSRFDLGDWSDNWLDFKPSRLISGSLWIGLRW